jgi:fermentation-respiration switch protein FrsA (DUF1100 family)
MASGVTTAGSWEWMRRAGAGAALMAGSALAVALGAGYYVASVVTRPGRATPKDDCTFSPFELSLPFEEVGFAPEHGDHNVRGWWLPRPDSQRVIIACTGYRAKMADLLGISAALWRDGNNVLLFDYHGHGAALGAPVTLAFRELDDFLGALDYVERRVPAARVGVIGYSMGAAVAIMGAARRPEVRAVVADSSFATHAGVVAHSLRHVTGAPEAVAAAIVGLADYFLLWRAGYRGRDVEPLREVSAIAPRPLLIIHSRDDATIPVEDAHRLYAAAGEPKELWIAQGAPHCCTYFLDRAGYCQRVTAFLAAQLSADAGQCVQINATAVDVEPRPAESADGQRTPRALRLSQRLVGRWRVPVALVGEKVSARGAAAS